jgi:hypothetical protein
MEQDGHDGLAATDRVHRVLGLPSTRGDAIGRPRRDVGLDVVGLQAHAELLAQRGIGEELDVRDADGAVGEVAVCGEDVEGESRPGPQLGHGLAQPVPRGSDQGARLRGRRRPTLLDHRRQLLVVIADIAAGGRELAHEGVVPRRAAEEVAADDAEPVLHLPHPPRAPHVGVHVVAQHEDAIVGARRPSGHEVREGRQRHRAVPAIQRAA